MKRSLTIFLLCFLARSAWGRDCVVTSDAKQVDDAVTVNGSGIVGSGSNPFLNTDVGKLMICSQNGGVITSLTAIASYQNAGQVTTTGLATASTGNVTCTWATSDATSAITAQVAACKTNVNSTFPLSGKFFGGDVGIVRLSGGYMVSGCIYDVSKTGALPSMIGSGSAGTSLFLQPGWTNCASGPVLINASGQGLTLQGFTIYGNGILFNGPNNIINMVQIGHFQMIDIQIINIGTNTTGSATLYVSSGDFGYFSNLLIQGSPSNSFDTACIIGMSGKVDNTFCSNHWRNLLVNGGSSRTPLSTGLNWNGGGADECGDKLLWCTYVADNSEFQTNGATMFGTTHVGSGASLYVTNGNMGKFNSPASVPALDVNSTGTVYSVGTTWRANGGASAVVNRGTFIDGGLNDYKNCVSSSCTTLTPGRAFTGNLPIRR